MSVVVKNNLATILDIPGLGLMFAVGEEQTVDSITAPLAAAIQAGQILLISQVATALVVVEGDGDTVFVLPFDWPGPDEVNLTVGGLVQVFGTDWDVDAAANTFEWLDAEIELKIGDVLIFTGRWS